MGRHPGVFHLTSAGTLPFVVERRSLGFFQFFERLHLLIGTNERCAAHGELLCHHFAALIDDSHRERELPAEIASGRGPIDVDAAAGAQSAHLLNLGGSMILVALPFGNESRIVGQYLREKLTAKIAPVTAEFQDGQEFELKGLHWTIRGGGGLARVRGVLSVWRRAAAA